MINLIIFLLISTNVWAGNIQKVDDQTVAITTVKNVPVQELKDRLQQLQQSNAEFQKRLDDNNIEISDLQQQLKDAADAGVASADIKLGP